MHTFRIQIANCCIEVNCIYENLVKVFKGFLTDEEPDVYISITQNDIEFEKRYALIKNGISMNNILVLAMVSLQRKVVEYLIEKNTILFHGAAISVADTGYIFAGKSRVGKTTHIYKWGMNCREMHVINGDKPFIHCADVPVLYSSPWAGKEELYKNICSPLKSIILMERAEENHIQELNFSQAFPFLLQQTYRSEDEEKMRKTLRLLQRLNGKVKFYRFQCNNFKDDCFDVAYNVLVGNNH